MNNDAFDYLLNYAWDKKIGYELTRELTPDSPSTAYPEEKLVIINMNWPNEKELPFQLAHEITHVTNGDDTQSKLYYHTTYKGKYGVEYKANIGGIELLVPYHFAEIEPESADIDQFIDAYAIPQYLRDYVIKETRNFYKIGE
ncbi:ImmA/IrrE family metallo-endopeptidase [Ligilactobacillus acidipiscis]|uniref:Uncharacterized protein n=1 Tax=Ligilactobacillus acidipiscis TaxID=89059 RepID=A0A0R2JL02_9LACO|nr:ImmA/IrrE family metallo-endopeptidase [Ligilactobacillus acidipiscis]KRN77934.1 hypothetical protein IV43_GL000630 [Ligilactobacillus acidipiscis]SFV39760.1 hypothetical protein LAC1533_0340 [Ligilactobacillus acidipiscis]